jgi:hypothetical protein
VLKVVSITQENWSTEEVILEELQVFQVRNTLRKFILFPQSLFKPDVNFL